MLYNITRERFPNILQTGPSRLNTFKVALKTQRGKQGQKKENSAQYDCSNKAPARSITRGTGDGDKAVLTGCSTSKQEQSQTRRLQLKLKTRSNKQALCGSPFFGHVVRSRTLHNILTDTNEYCYNRHTIIQHIYYVYCIYYR